MAGENAGIRRQNNEFVPGCDWKVAAKFKPSKALPANEGVFVRAIVNLLRPVDRWNLRKLLPGNRTRWFRGARIRERGSRT